MKGGVAWYLWLSHKIECHFSKVLSRLAKLCATRPYLMLFAPLLLLSVSVAGYANFGIELKFINFMIPQESRPIIEFKGYERLWGKSAMAAGIVYEEEGGDILQMDRLLEMHAAFVRGTSAVGEDGDSTVRLDDICERVEGECSVASVLLYFECVSDPCVSMRSLELADNIRATDDIHARISDPEAVDSFGRPLALLRRTFLGGISPEDAIKDPTVPVTAATHAINVAFTHYVDEDKDDGVEKDRVQCWETAFIDAWDEEAPERSYAMASRSEQDGIEETSTGNFDLIAISMLVMVLVVVFAISPGWPLRRSRASLALLGVSLVTYSVVVAYGITVGAGWKITPAAQLTFFILLSTGANGYFALLSEFDRRKAEFVRMHPAGPHVPGKDICAVVPCLLAGTVHSVGASIAYTSGTSILAFFSAGSTEFPVLRSFSITTGIAVIVNFVLTSTCFIAGMALDERRKLRSRLDIFCCIVAARGGTPHLCERKGAARRQEEIKKRKAMGLPAFEAGPTVASGGGGRTRAADGVALDVNEIEKDGYAYDYDTTSGSYYYSDNSNAIAIDSGSYYSYNDDDSNYGGSDDDSLLSFYSYDDDDDDDEESRIGSRGFSSGSEEYADDGAGETFAMPVGIHPIGQSRGPPGSPGRMTANSSGQDSSTDYSAYSSRSAPTSTATNNDRDDRSQQRRSKQLQHTTPKCSNRGTIHQQEMCMLSSGANDPVLERAFRRYGKFFGSRAVSGTIIVLALLATSLAAWGTAGTQVSFDPGDFLPNASDAKHFLDERKVGFAGEVGDAVLFSVESRDFTSVESQQELESIFNGIVSSDRFRADQTYSAFQITLARARDTGVATELPGSYIPPGQFNKLLDETLSLPGMGAILKGDVDRDTTGRVIKARIRAELLPITTLGPDSVKAMDAAFEICDDVYDSEEYEDLEEAKVDADVAAATTTTTTTTGSEGITRCSAFAETAFPFAQMVRQVKKELFPQVALAWGLVTIFLFIVNPPAAAAIMSFLLAMTVVNIIGFVRLIGLTIDPTNLIALAIASGLAVDFQIHVTHLFTMTDGTRAERVAVAFGKLGAATLLAGLSTALGTAVLLFARSLGFTYFALIFIITDIMGLITGIVILPAVLFFIGPSTYNQFHPGDPVPKPASKSKLKSMGREAYRKYFH